MASARTCNAWSEGRAEAGVGRGFITYQCISVLIHYAATQQRSIIRAGAGRAASQIVQRGPPGLEDTMGGFRKTDRPTGTAAAPSSGPGTRPGQLAPAPTHPSCAQRAAPSPLRPVSSPPLAGRPVALPANPENTYPDSWMQRLIIALPGNEAFADQLAAACGAERGHLETRRFPDGESYVRLHSDVAGRAVDLVCTLARPDEQLAMLLFTADCARELGATEVN